MVKLAAGHWNKDFLDEVEIFPYGSHDDQVDAASLAFNKLRSSGIRFAGDPSEEYEHQQRKEIQKLIASGCMRPGAAVRWQNGAVIDLRPDAPGWQ